MLVEKANKEIGDEDGLVVYPWTNWAIGYYGKWPARIIKAEDSSNGFYVHLLRPRTLVLHETYKGVNFYSDPHLAQNQLSEFLASGFNRLFYISSLKKNNAHKWIVNYIIEQGYRKRVNEKYYDGNFMLFEKGPVK